VAAPGYPGVRRPVNATAIAQAVKEAGLAALNPEALARFEAYLALLLKWNSRLNLTAIRRPEAIVRRHFVECIQCAQELPQIPEPATLLDFGSGAGFPGIPIAICRPDISVTLTESQRKKAAFLREVVRTLDLKAEIFDGRVEQMPTSQRFTYVTLRAVDKMTEACEAALPRVATQGWLIVFSTTGTEAELEAALPEIGWRRKVPIAGLERGQLLFGQPRH
jgi:16S rRNA (guanine527-N7)-methyltransferase